MSATTATTASAGMSLRLTFRVRPFVRWTLALTVLGMAVAVGFARFDLHMSMSSVLTGSMRPAFAPGDAVITRPIAVTEVRPGMVILAAPEGRSTPYAHRVIAVKQAGGNVLVRTQGDANPGPDDWRDVYAPTSHVSVVVTSVPKLGYLLEALHGRTTQRNVVPVGVAGTLLTFVACAFVLLADVRKPAAVR